MASIYSPLYEQLGAPVVAYYQQRSTAAAREHREKLPLVHISASSNWVGSRGHAFGKGIRKEITSSIDAKYIPNIQEEAWLLMKDTFRRFRDTDIFKNLFVTLWIECDQLGTCEK